MPEGSLTINCPLKTGKPGNFQFWIAVGSKHKYLVNLDMLTNFYNDSFHYLYVYFLFGERNRFFPFSEVASNFWSHRC